MTDNWLTDRAPRITPGGRRQVGPFVWTFSRVAGWSAGTGPLNLFLTLGRNRQLFWGWLHFAGRLMPGGSLPRRETEMVILRVASLAGCDYERVHHLRLGAKAGLTPAQIGALTAADPEPSDPAWTDRDQAILEAVGALHQNRDIDDDRWSTLRRHLDERQSIELCLLVGHYEMLATTIRTLGVELDRPTAR